VANLSQFAKIFSFVTAVITLLDKAG
jgi:hypothetical protein